MPHAVEAVFRDALRHAGLPGHGAMARVFVLLRASPATHLTCAQVADLVAEAGLAVTPVELARHLDTLADHGLLGRLPTTTSERVFDTVAEPHSHLIYEESAQVVDLHVSTETLLAMVRDALTRRPRGVELLVRFLREPPTACETAVSTPTPQDRLDPGPSG